VNIESDLVRLSEEAKKVGAASKHTTPNFHWTFKPVVLKVHELFKFAIFQTKCRTILVVPTPTKVHTLLEPTPHG